MFKIKPIIKIKYDTVSRKSTNYIWIKSFLDKDIACAPFI